jgi:hypothetical protein
MALRCEWLLTSLPDITVDTVTGAPLLTHRVELALLAVASEDCVRAWADDDHTVGAVINRDLRAVVQDLDGAPFAVLDDRNLLIVSYRRSTEAAPCRARAVRRP